MTGNRFLLQPHELAGLVDMSGDSARVTGDQKLFCSTRPDVGRIDPVRRRCRHHFRRCEANSNIIAVTAPMADVTD